MSNQWNDFFEGLINGGGKIASALIEKNNQTDLEALHQKSMKVVHGFLDGTLEKQADQTDTDTGELQGIGKYEKTGPPNKVGALNFIYDQMPEYLKYGDQGKQYIDILKGLYNNTLSLPEGKRFTGRYMMRRTM